MADKSTLEGDAKRRRVEEATDGMDLEVCRALSLPTPSHFPILHRLFLSLAILTHMCALAA